MLIVKLHFYNTYVNIIIKKVIIINITYGFTIIDQIPFSIRL